ncbi:MAG: HAMP domain-containing protein, partial [Acetobacteraceae bacterium]
MQNPITPAPGGPGLAGSNPGVSDPGAVGPDGEPPREPVRAWPGYIADFLLDRGVTIGLVVLAVATGVATFVILARGAPFAIRSGIGVGLVWANLSVLLLLGLVLAGRLTRVVTERRRGAAGARLHVRLVLLYSGVAVAPSIVVAGFAVAFFHFGIQAWFNDPVRTAVTESLQVARGYLEEHRNNIRAVALEMANDINRSGQLLAIDPRDFARALAEQTTLRGLTDAVIYDAASEQVMASAGLFGGLGVTPPPRWAVAQALHGDVVVLDSAHGAGVRAVVALDSTPALVMMVGRPVDPEILNYMQRTEQAVSQYKRLDANRSWLQLAFAWIFAMVALLVLSAAVLIGLVMANQIARPIGRLIQAAERVRGGDLAVRVPEKPTDDEVAGLSRAFNRMTGQLAAQRGELMAAYRQIDERRRFTEAVLSGVSAGVIGLDPQGRIE